MSKLDSKAVYLFFFTYLFRFLIFSLYLTLIIGGFAFGLVSKGKNVDSGFFVNLFAIYFLAISVWAYLWAIFAYRNYKYQMTDNGFRKECGVIWKKYVTIPYDKIQNVDIYRGVIARILGLSDLHIQTAGLSASSGVWIWEKVSEGRVPGLSKTAAEELRNELIKRAKDIDGKNGI